MNGLEVAERYGWIIAVILIAVFYKVVLRVLFGTVIIAKEEIGIVNRKWVLFGNSRTLPAGGGDKARRH